MQLNHALLCVFLCRQSQKLARRSHISMTNTGKPFRGLMIPSQPVTQMKLKLCKIENKSSEHQDIYNQDEEQQCSHTQQVAPDSVIPHQQGRMFDCKEQKALKMAKMQSKKEPQIDSVNQKSLVFAKQQLKVPGSQRSHQQLENKLTAQHSFEDQTEQQVYSLLPQILEDIKGHNQNVVDPCAFPPPHAVHACLQVLQSSNIPKLGQIIKTMHTMLHHRCRRNTDPVKYAHIVVPEPWEKKKAHIKSNDDLNLEKKIALCFVNYGYGTHILREHIHEFSISIGEYNALSWRVVKNAFRRLEKFVKSHIRPLRTLSEQELDNLRVPLMTCRDWLVEEECSVLHDFVKIHVNIQTPAINPKIADKLYDRFLLQIEEVSQQTGIQQMIGQAFQ